MRRLIGPWEYRHRRATAGVRFAAGGFTLGIGLVLLSLGRSAGTSQERRKCYGWAAWFLVSAPWQFLGGYRGTHNGDLAGIAPTGKHVEYTASDMFKLSDGRIIESWHNVDDFGLLQQLGVIPAG